MMEKTWWRRYTTTTQSPSPFPKLITVLQRFNIHVDNNPDHFLPQKSISESQPETQRTALEAKLKYKERQWMLLAPTHT
jgi:hypothetical protein